MLMEAHLCVGVGLENDRVQGAGPDVSLIYIMDAGRSEELPVDEV